MWIKRFVCSCCCCIVLLIYGRKMQFTFLLHFIHFALSILNLAFLVVTHTAVILLDELVVALHQARVVSRDMMRLELVERYVGDLHDHLEPCAAVVIVHRHGDNILLITDVLDFFIY